MGPETGQSFPAACRIRKSYEYQRLYKTGRRIALPHFVIYSATPAQGPSRLGITVSRKVGNAVMRNRCKRVTRDFFRLIRNELVQPVDLSVQFRPAAAQLSNEEIRAELYNGLVRAGMISP